MALHSCIWVSFLRGEEAGFSSTRDLHSSPIGRQREQERERALGQTNHAAGRSPGLSGWGRIHSHGGETTARHTQRQPGTSTHRIREGPRGSRGLAHKKSGRDQGKQRPGTWVQSGTRAQLQGTCPHTSAPAVHPLCRVHKHLADFCSEAHAMPPELVTAPYWSHVALPFPDLHFPYYLNINQ